MHLPLPRIGMRWIPGRFGGINRETALMFLGFALGAGYVLLISWDGGHWEESPVAIAFNQTLEAST